MASSGEVAVVDLATLKVAGRYRVGQAPLGLACCVEALIFGDWRWLGDGLLSWIIDANTGRARILWRRSGGGRLPKSPAESCA